MRSTLDKGSPADGRHQSQNGRGMKDVFAGVDCHKTIHAVVFVDSIGSELQAVVIANDAAGFETALSAAQSFGCQVLWGLEGAGGYGRRFADFLVANNATVFEVPGNVTKRHRKNATRPGKTDTIDAKAIAEALIREQDRLPRYRQSEELLVLRLRYDQRDRLVRQRTVEVNRLKAAASMIDLKLEDDCTKSSALGAVRAAAIARQGQRHSVDAYVDEILIALEAIERINVHVAHIERALIPFVEALAPELLEVRGVGAVTAAGLLGHAGDVRNLRNADAFAAKCGTAPVPCSSGKTSAVRVNTGGNRKLNRLLYTIATTQVRTEKHAGKIYYERKRSEGHNSRAALRALKRQLTKVVYRQLVKVHTRLQALPTSHAA
jgi:transposase